MVSADQYLTADRTGVKWAALASTAASTLILAITGFWLTVLESLVQYQVFIIRGFGTFLENLIATVLGDGAGLVVASWRAAAVQATEAGPLAPFLLALEAVVILTIVFAIWERRPFTL